MHTCICKNAAGVGCRPGAAPPPPLPGSKVLGVKHADGDATRRRPKKAGKLQSDGAHNLRNEGKMLGAKTVPKDRVSRRCTRLRLCACPRTRSTKAKEHTE